MPRCRAHLRFTDLELAVGKPGVMDGRPHLTCHCRPNFYTSTKLHSLVTKAQQCEWLAQSHWTATVWLAVEPATSWSQVRCPICCATMTHYIVIWPTMRCFADWSKHCHVIFTITECWTVSAVQYFVDGSTVKNTEPSHDCNIEPWH